MSRAVADTSVLIALEHGRPLGELPSELAISVITTAELELGVLRATTDAARSARLATLTQVRSNFPLLEIDAATASWFARIASAELAAGRTLRAHDTWIAATAARHSVPVVTQDADFARFDEVEVLRV